MSTAGCGPQIKTEKKKKKLELVPCIRLSASYLDCLPPLKLTLAPPRWHRRSALSSSPCIPILPGPDLHSANPDYSPSTQNLWILQQSQDPEVGGDCSKDKVRQFALRACIWVSHQSPLQARRKANPGLWSAQLLIFQNPQFPLQDGWSRLTPRKVCLPRICSLKIDAAKNCLSERSRLKIIQWQSTLKPGLCQAAENR